MYGLSNGMVANDPEAEVHLCRFKPIGT